MMKIGEFSKLCQVPVNTLRYYDGEGLLKPDFVDPITGYRFYSGDSLKRFHVLTALKNAGFSLEEIRKILDSGDNFETVLEKRERELRAGLAEWESRLLRLAGIRNLWRKEGKRMFGIMLKENVRFLMAGTRKIFKTREEAFALAGETAACLQSLGAADVSPAIINYETEYSMAEIDGMAGAVFTGPLPKGCPYETKMFVNSGFAEGEAASIICGPDETDDAYSELIRFLDAQNYQIVGAFYEIERDGGAIEILVPVHKLSPFTEQPKTDELDRPFENDESVLGRWEAVDRVVCREQFNKDKIKYTGEKPIKELYFLPSGERYWCFGWTNGLLLTSFGYPDSCGADRYELEEIDGNAYMFVQMKTTLYFRRGGLPEIWVFRQTDKKAYTKAEIGAHDDIDRPFILDDSVLGRWAVCDMVDDIGQYDPDSPNPAFPKDALFWKTAEFGADGNCRVLFGESAVHERPVFSWTKGFVLNHPSSLAMGYTLRRIKGCDTLFIEWKSGDYVFGGRKPDYYVFRRAE